MSLLIKALQKAEQSKDAKAAEKPVAKTGLSLELAPQEPKPEPAQAAAVSTPEATESRDSGLSLSLTDQAGLPLASSPEMASTTEPTLADEAGFSEPLLKTPPLKTPPPKVEPAKAPAPKSEPPLMRAGSTVPPPEKMVAGKPMDDVSSTSAKTMSPEPAAQRQAAASLLSLQPDDQRRASANNRRSLWLGGGALLLLLVVGGGFYYYLQTLEQPQLVMMQPVPHPSQQAAQPQPVPPPAAESGATAEAPVTAEATEPKDQMEMAAAKPDNKVDTKPVTGKSTQTAESGFVADAAPVARTPRATRAAVAGDEAPLQVARLRKGEPATNATHMAAYQAYTNGDDAAAGKLYKQLLQAEPRNVDALLGLAAVAARQERMDEAASHYQRVLELDPRNSIAQAGLIALLGQANPTEAESRLKTLIAQQPDAAYLHAALGGVYADQNQWPNAQQAYFQAFRLDAGSADYAFNLAVSLDQINKPDLALNYYQRALDLLPKQPGAVDKAALETRIGQLRSTLGK